MKTRKKLPVIAYIIAIIYVFVFVIVMAGTLIVPARVYDDQKLLAQNLNSANKINYELRRQDGVTTVTCEKMQGMDIIWEQYADKDIKCQMYYHFNVTSGKAKLVLIQPDGTVITLAEQDSNTTGSSPKPQTDAAGSSDEMPFAEVSVVELELKKGSNRIKIVCGKGTAFSLSFKISES